MRERTKSFLCLSAHVQKGIFAFAHESLYGVKK
jgi:hypothetical protein